MSLLIYSTLDSPRLRYVLTVCFGRWLRLPYRLTNREAAYLAYEGPRLHYGRVRLTPDELLVPAGALLAETHRDRPAPRVYREGERPYYFREAIAGADFPFDLFSLLFYTLSRYEEYGPYEPDLHGRFPASCSLAGRNGFLDYPVVDAWLAVLRGRLNERFPGLSLPTVEYAFHPTYDIDLAWAYRRRPMLRLAGGAVRDLLRRDPAVFRERLAVLAGRRQDPFDTFAYLGQGWRAYQLTPAFFFLRSNPRRYDRGVPSGDRALHRLIRDISARFPVGIHPSYYSNDQPGRLEAEVQWLSGICGRPVTISRQHFLRLRIPDTYRRLLAAGIRADYTLGYADDIGFRAGTARAFPWFDLEREQTTVLELHPFQVMDATLKHYLGLSPAAASDRIAVLIERTRRFGGVFRPLWHNSSFAKNHGWNGWTSVYEDMLRAGAD